MQDFEDILEMFEDYTPDPRPMVPEPRNMYNQGQLVRNTVDGSRPGYGGTNAKTNQGFQVGNSGNIKSLENKNTEALKIKLQKFNRAKELLKQGKSKAEAMRIIVNEFNLTRDPYAGTTPWMRQAADEIINEGGTIKAGTTTEGEGAKKRGAKKRYKLDKDRSSVSIQRKIRAPVDSGLNLTHAGGKYTQVGLHNLIYAEGSANRRMVKPFEDKIFAEMDKFYKVYNNPDTPDKFKRLAGEEYLKADRALRKKYPEYAKLKTRLSFKNTPDSKLSSFAVTEKLPNPKLAISNEPDMLLKGETPTSEKGKKIIGLSEKSFKEVVNNSKRGGALLTHEMLNKSEKFKKVKICKTKFANGGGGLCGKAYAEKYPQEFLQEVMKDSRMASYLKSKEALAVGKSFLSKTAKVGRWANPLTLVGGEAWWSTLAGINEFSKGKSLGEAVNEGLWFLPGKHYRDREWHLFKDVSEKDQDLFRQLETLGGLINKEEALSGQLQMQKWYEADKQNESDRLLHASRFDFPTYKKNIAAQGRKNFFQDMDADINWSKTQITPQIEERLKNVMTEGEEVVQKYKAADPKGQSYLKLQDVMKSKIVDEYNKGKTWDQADPHSGSIWNWIKTRENIPFTDPDLVAKQKKLDLLKEGPDRTITKENIPPELIEDFLMKFPKYKYAFAEGGLAGLMKKYYD